MVIEGAPDAPFPGEEREKRSGTTRKAGRKVKAAPEEEQSKESLRCIFRLGTILK